MNKLAAPLSLGNYENPNSLIPFLNEEGELPELIAPRNALPLGTHKIFIFVDDVNTHTSLELLKMELEVTGLTNMAICKINGRKASVVKE